MSPTKKAKSNYDTLLSHQLKSFGDGDMDTFEVQCSRNKYELAGFLKHHPGGVNYLQNYRDKDVSQRMEETYHSKSAFYLLRGYKIGGRDKENYSENEDLENLVDWTKPMLCQVGNLGTKYNEWVLSPVDRELRLFGNQILEILTITPWFIVPIIWLPVVIYYIYMGFLNYTKLSEDSTPMLKTICYILLGIIIWTLIEYSLHRWVFHITPSGYSKLLIYIHFTIHGLHHKAPFDTRRLVFPPVPAAIIVYLGYHLYSIVFPEAMFQIVLGGTILGYVIYDMIHFYLHYGAPKEGGYLYNMKRYHNQHHFVHHNKGFGISGPGWDNLFGTIIYLRKLYMGIKWK